MILDIIKNNAEYQYQENLFTKELYFYYEFESLFKVSCQLKYNKKSQKSYTTPMKNTQFTVFTMVATRFMKLINVFQNTIMF